MPIGTCDPASRGDAYNEGQFAQGENGAVVVTYRYGWDGTSTRETGCIGPLIYLSGTNNSAVTYYAHFQGRRGQWRRVELAPGATVTESNRQKLRQQGFETNQDVEGLYITTDPNPPSNALKA